MKRINFLAFLIILVFPLSAMAGGDPIKSAESAGPPDLASKATIKDWDGKVLRKGSNGWTCLPDMAGRRPVDPVERYPV